MGANPKVPCSLRHYLLNDREIGSRLKAKVILAERANQLYRDTEYKDLISFEEDIARISALVLLIAESAGSLAELGAFASIDSIRANLAVLIQTSHNESESFVRYGPIQRLKIEDERRVGVYPWTINKGGNVVKSSIRSHVSRITAFVNTIISRAPGEESLKSRQDIRSFVMILWILHLSQGISITEILRYIHGIVDLTFNDLKNKLYCMKLAGWVSTYTYENKTYWFSTSELDPISKYSFIPGAVRDTARRKMDVSIAIQKELKVPRHVREYVAAQKGAAA